MEDNKLIEDITILYKNKKWLEIIDKYHNHAERNKLLWVYPSEENLNFLNRTLKKLNCSEIVSVGCGSGLLEWIIKESTGVAVFGIEVDGAWWECKYSPPTFLPLHFSNPNLDKDVETQKVLQTKNKNAIMFCYFNNGPAFHKYLEYFNGEVLIIIGPVEGRGTHTNPRPFDDVDSSWMLYDCQEVRNSKDYIAIYCRN